MDPQPSEGSPSSSGSSQRKARKRPWDSDEAPPSLGPETSLSPPTEPDTTGPGASADGATTSKVLSSLEEPRNTLDKDSESFAEDSVTPRKSPGKCDEHARPIFFSIMENLHGHFTGETLDFWQPCTEADGRYWCKLMNMVRHTYGLLTGAADFARGARRDRRCALALERIHGHPGLLEEVARREKVDQARAAAMVRKGLHSIEGMHEFMRLAGVVKERVSCHACRDGRTQLDALNEDCWRAVRRYLKLYHIGDSTTGVPAQ